MFYAVLFCLSAGLNILLGAHAWPGVLAGSLNDPDSYMRLLRIEQGIHAGHLVVTVARDDSGAGVMVEWSRLLDMLLWAMAAPLAAVLGWHRALYAAGVALGPLGVGFFGMVLAWVVEPFAARKYLWAAAVAAALLPGLLTIALPGVVHYHILLLAMIALTVGFVARAWQGDSWPGFLAGVSGGFALWLTPETMPFVLMAYAALLLRWLTFRMEGTLMACAAGFFDVLGFGLTIDPPQGGYGVPEIDRLSFVYVALGLALLVSTGLLWRLETSQMKYRRPLGVVLMAVVMLSWIAAFPKVAMGPYGLMSAADRHKFYSLMLELQPLHGADLWIFLGPGVLALVYALWRAAAGRAHWQWFYIAACVLVALVLGAKFVLFAGFSAAAAAALLPLAMSEISFRAEEKPSLAMLGRLGVLLAVLGVPEMAAMASPAAMKQAGGARYPSCSLREIAPLLAPVGRNIVLAEAQDTPELLYRSGIETVGSLYQHGVPGYLRDRDAWRAVPGDQVPPALQATGASYVLFCPEPGRYLPVADLPKTTLWDALEANGPPVWLKLLGSDAAGWRLYAVQK